MEQAIVLNIKSRAEMLINALLYKRIYSIKDIFVKPIYQNYFKFLDKLGKSKIQKYGHPLNVYFVSIQVMEDDDDDFFYYFCEYHIKFQKHDFKCLIYLKRDYSIERIDIC